MNNEKTEIGFVKWYGGYNHNKNQENKFGFISKLEPAEDIFVHERGLKCHPDKMIEDAIVAFEVKANQRTGKKQAVNVRTVNFDQVEDFHIGLQNNDQYIWETAFSELDGIPRIDEDVAVIIQKKLDQLDDYNKERMVSYIPDQAFYDYVFLRQYLNANKWLEITIDLWKKSADSEVRESYFHKIKEKIIKNHQLIEHVIWDKLPEEMIVQEEVWGFVPVQKKIETLLKQIENKNERDDNLLQKLASYIKISGKDQQLPESLKRDFIIFPSLNDYVQVEVAWANLANYWSYMSRNAKIMSIFRAVKEKQTNLSFLNAEEEEDSLVKILLRLAKNDQNMPLHQLFHTFQSSFNHYMNELITSLPANEIIDLRPLLPSCSFHSSSDVLHCEGKRWRTKDGKWKEDYNGDELAFCPRIYHTCRVKTISDQEGAHIHPITELSWEHWTLVEFFEALGIQAENYVSMRNDEKYILKLAGWVNRINDIKQRLFCFDCNKPLEPDLTYSKNFARYNITVAQCPDCKDKVYFNHCWNCHHIIDSRQSKMKYNNYYICIACGSGPQPSYKSEPILKQGSICPNCGTHDMEDFPNDSNIKQCKNCNHKIHLKGKIKYNELGSNQEAEQACNIPGELESPM